MQKDERESQIKALEVTINKKGNIWCNWIHWAVLSIICPPESIQQKNTHSYGKRNRERTKEMHSPTIYEDNIHIAKWILVSPKCLAITNVLKLIFYFFNVIDYIQKSYVILDGITREVR